MSKTDSYNPTDTKPKKSGVFEVRCKVQYAQTNEDASYCEGFAYFDRTLNRWGSISLTPNMAKNRKSTAAWIYKADQNKEWKKYAKIKP